MKRYAAHYIYLSPEKTYHLHVIELDEEGKIRDIFPLKEEIESTEFYNGTIIPLKKNIALPHLIENIHSLEDLKDWIVSDKTAQVDLYHLHTTHWQITKDTIITRLC